MRFHDRRDIDVALIRGVDTCFSQRSRFLARCLPKGANSVISFRSGNRVYISPVTLHTIHSARIVNLFPAVEPSRWVEDFHELLPFSPETFPLTTWLLLSNLDGYSTMQDKSSRVIIYRSDKIRFCNDCNRVRRFIARSSTVYVPRVDRGRVSNAVIRNQQQFHVRGNARIAHTIA